MRFSVPVAGHNTSSSSVEIFRKRVLLESSNVKFTLIENLTSQQKYPEEIRNSYMRNITKSNGHYGTLDPRRQFALEAQSVKMASKDMKSSNING